MVLLMNYPLAFKKLLPSIQPKSLAAGTIAAVSVWAVVYFKGKNGKKFRQGEEYGSARWGNEKDIAPFIDPVFENNILLTQTERLTMNSRPKKPKYARNKNVIVIGGSGSGKTRFYVKPQLMQMPDNVSFVVTDPKGTIIVECGKMLARGTLKKDKNGKILRDKNGRVVMAPYKIKVLNTINFAKSMHYNPFHYIRSEKDILKLVNTIMVNTKGEGEKSSEDFWTKAERLLYCALIGYIYYEAPEEEQNFSTLLEFINASETREEDEEFKNAVDLLFEELERDEPNHFAVRQYKKYKLAAGKTAKSILISCGARLAPFDIAELRELMSYDEMELDMIGDQRTALFIVISDTDDTFNFVVAMMYSQLFNLLCDRADDVHHGRLPYHVRILCDEFANIGQIPKFDKLIATIRSREISASIILQSQSQLKTIYKDAAETITGNCDTMLFLGGKESTTLKEISETLGKETIDLYNTSDTRGQSRSYGLRYDVGNSAYTLLACALIPIWYKSLAVGDGAGQISSDRATAYYAVAIAVMTVVSALIGPVCGAIADHMRIKKAIFSTTVVVGVSACILNGFTPTWVLFLVIYVLTKIFYNASLVFYDSMLVDVTTKDRMDEVSSYGYAWGYLGSCVPFLVSLAAYICGPDMLGYISNRLSMIIGFAVTGIWWFVVTIPLFKSYKQVNYVSDAADKDIHKNFEMMYL